MMAIFERIGALLWRLLTAFPKVALLSGIGYCLIGFLLYLLLNNNTGNVLRPIEKADSLAARIGRPLTRTCPQDSVFSQLLAYNRSIQAAHRQTFYQYFVTYNTSAILGLIASVMAGFCLFLIARDGWNSDGNQSLKWVFGVSVIVASVGTLVPQVFMHESNVVTAAASYNQGRVVQFKILSDRIRCCYPLDTGDRQALQARDSLMHDLHRLGQLKLVVPSVDLSKIKTAQLTDLQESGDKY